jgi:hypothetical protein
LASKSSLQGKKVTPDFFLTWKPGGNKIQLQSFGGCDSVETDSPINITLVEQGKKMLTLRCENFYFVANTPLYWKIVNRCADPDLKRQVNVESENE